MYYIVGVYELQPSACPVIIHKRETVCSTLLGNMILTSSKYIHCIVCDGVGISVGTEPSSSISRFAVPVVAFDCESVVVGTIPLHTYSLLRCSIAIDIKSILRNFRFIFHAGLLARRLYNLDLESTLNLSCLLLPW